MRGGEVAEERLTGPGGGDPGEGTQGAQGQRGADAAGAGGTGRSRGPRPWRGRPEGGRPDFEFVLGRQTTSETQRLQPQELGETQGR